MEFKVQIVMPIVETPKGSVSLNPDGYSIDSFDALKFVELNKHTIHIHDAFIAPSAMRCILTIAKDMINIMTAEFDAVGAMDAFTVDLIHNDAGFGENRRVDFLDAVQKLQRREITRPRTDGRVQTRHGFKVVVEHIGFCRNHGVNRVHIAPKIPW